MGNFGCKISGSDSTKSLDLSSISETNKNICLGYIKKGDYDNARRCMSNEYTTLSNTNPNDPRLVQLSELITSTGNTALKTYADSLLRNGVTGGGMKGGLANLEDYGNSLFSKAKENLIRNIAKDIAGVLKISSSFADSADLKDVIIH